MMETIKDIQLERLMVPVLRAVLALVVSAMASMAVDVPMAPGAPALPAPVLATTMAVPEPAARRLWRLLGESDWKNTCRSGRTLN